MSVTESQEATKRLPFHEAIVDEIFRASSSELEMLGRLIKKSKVPGKHDRIIEAWIHQAKKLGWRKDASGIVANLREQRQEVERKEEEKAAKKAEEAAQPLFPPYLDQGSTGTAVNVLGLLLKFLGYDPNDLIVLDGEYGSIIATAVGRLQLHLKFEGNEVDGNFGPSTRTRLEHAYGVDLNTLTVEMFTQPTVGKGPSSD